MNHHVGLPRSTRKSGWWGLAPTIAIIICMIVLTGQTNAASGSRQTRELLGDISFQEQKPLCESCHPTQHADWQGTHHAKATLGSDFQASLSKSPDRATCLTCHTTGFDEASGKFLTEGVSCEACHGEYQDGHPAKATMQLPMESETCHVCHQSTFAQWEGSSHAGKNIECFDCHQAHDQGLRLDNQQKLCGSCHDTRQTELAHATHGINGVSCVSCHMSEASLAMGSGVEIQARSHTFKVSGDVCAGCHQGSVHSSSKLAAVNSGDAIIDPATKTLQGEVSRLQTRVDSVRNIGVAAAGLAFGGGGFVGLLVGVAGMSVWRKRKQ